MHLHLPKPLHGWREFTGEVGIIVLGVLIALGAQQVAEALHDENVAAATRAGLREEIRDNMRTLNLRQKSEACMQIRLREIAAYLAAASKGDRPKPLSWIGAPYAPLVYHTRFQSAQSAGKFFLLPDDEQQQFAGFYLDFDDFNEADTREWYDWAQLRTLAGQTAALSAADIARLQSALQDARAADAFIRIDTAHLIDRAKGAGLVSSQRWSDPYQVASVCLRSDTPYAQGLAAASLPGRPFPE
jgi:hypothetical protein